MDDQALEKALTFLTDKERHAYGIWRGTQLPGLAPSLNAKLFNLFLQGKGTDEIRRMNQQLTLGQIVSARVEGEWDERRKEHLDRLLTDTSLRVQQVTLETADFVCDMLAVANKEHGERLRRYLQSGEVTDLGDFRIDTLNGLKQTIDILQKLTGQDKQQKLSVSGEIIHRPESEQQNNKPSSEQAVNALRLLIGGK